MITLPDMNSDEGVEARVLLAECRGPAYSDYKFEAAAECMRLMDTVLWNRMETPRPFLAPNAHSLADIVMARGQFAGLGNYPALPPDIRHRIDDILEIANKSTDPRNTAYVEFVQKAIEIAKSPVYDDQSPGRLVAWRTAGHGSPGRGFLLFKTILGNDFFYTTN
jgi:hypothetical protein